MNIISVEEKWSDRLALPAEDYLHGLITVVNELVCSQFLQCVIPVSYDMTMQSRLAVNAVTLGNFDEPIKISIFVKDLFTGFSMVNSIALRPLSSLILVFLLQSNQLNLKNDTLRRRFDSLKYDIKKIEEGNEATLFDLLITTHQCIIHGVYSRL